MSPDNTLSPTAMRDAFRIDWARRRKRGDPRHLIQNSRRYFRHDTWYNRVIVVPSRPGDIVIVTEGWAFMTVAEEMAEFAVRVRVALVRIGSSKDVLSGEMRVAGWTGT
jgi:hypothetical protein